MKFQIRLALAALLLAATAMLPAFAAEAPILTFTGNVQICSGAAANATCKPAVPNQPLPAGSHLMVGPGATAQLQYLEDGIVNFTEPGLYTVNALPVRNLPGSNYATQVQSASSIASSMGFITFAGLIAAAGVASSVTGEDENLLVPISE